MFEHKTNIDNEFVQQATKTPDAVAIKSLTVSLSYRELNIRANILAGHLKKNGVVTNSVVAIEISHSIEFVISMLAVLKCGSAYLPLDGDGPEKRNCELLNVANTKVLITTTPLPKQYFNQYLTISVLDSKLFSGHWDKSIACLSEPNDMAYVMFTSGSTGKPKGVLVPHRAVLRLVKNTNYIQISSSDKILQFAPASFDASTFEIWGALLNGATLVLYSGIGLDPNLLRIEIEQNDVTILWLTAALFHLVADKFENTFRPLRVLLAGGDVLNPKYVNKVLDRIPGITVINGYGPTENTTFTCCHVMTKKNRPSNNVPIGKAINGTHLHIVDDKMRPVLSGDIGELLVSGRGVALGYLGSDDSSDAFFHQSSISDGLLYRTGDLVKQSLNGELEFVGRRDNQVKIRGYRVSLEEIKTSIVELANISDALVVTKKFESGDQLLVAYIKIQNELKYSVKEIKSKLAVMLPVYMIPDQFIFGPELPINSNGKVDKKLMLEISP